MNLKEKLVVGGAVVLGSFALLTTLGGGSTGDSPKPRPEAPTAVASYSECVAHEGTLEETKEHLFCSFDGELYTIEKPKSRAHQTGEQLGETYNDLKETGKGLLEGFKESTTVDETGREMMDSLKKKYEDMRESSLENNQR